MRSTESTITALERLATAMEVEVTRDGKLFAVHHPSDSEFGPLTKNSPQALAGLAFMARFRKDWEELRQATNFNPGRIRLKNRYAPDIPTHGLSGWEVEALERLAIIEETDDE
jgi:hypothetical protein